MNPYREMNTSLVGVNYPLETVQLKLYHFNSYLHGSPGSLTAKFKMHNVNWYVTGCESFLQEPKIYYQTGSFH